MAQNVEIILLPVSAEMKQVPEKKFISLFIEKSANPAAIHSADEAHSMISLIMLFNHVLKSSKQSQKLTEDDYGIRYLLELMPCLFSIDGKNAMGTSVFYALDRMQNNQDILYNEPLILSIVGIHASLVTVASKSPSTIAGKAASNAIEQIFVANSKVKAAFEKIYATMAKTSLARTNLLFPIMRIFIESSVETIDNTALAYKTVMKDSYLLFIRVSV